MPYEFEEYDMKHDNGETFTMGADIEDCKPGDAVKVRGRIEIIKSISSSGKWDKDIRTEEGGSYGMMDVNCYGKRKKDSSSD